MEKCGAKMGRIYGERGFTSDTRCNGVVSRLPVYWGGTDRLTFCVFEGIPPLRHWCGPELAEWNFERFFPLGQRVGAIWPSGA
jgi:hypothetical protein